jgi:anaerobic selenocysteine-containing dehydrogenase
MGLGEYFWENEASAFDAILKPSGMSYADLSRIGMVKADKQFKKYENRGFGTSTGKVELFSEQLKEIGIDPLPTYVEPSQTPLSSPDRATEYPLVLTNYKNPFYYHASHRNIQSLRKLSPEPIVEMNPQTGSELGLNENDDVYIETPKGRIKQKLRWNKFLDSRVVTVAHGWWFPEGKSEDLYHWDVANLNILTDDSYPCDPAMGAPTLRGIMCKVYKS